jgi:general stress protein 26
MAHDEHPTKSLTDLLDGGDVVMLMTMIGPTHSSRPLTVAGVDGRRISMLVDRTVDWAVAIGDPGTVVHIAASDQRSNVYLSLNGTASVVPDRTEVERLWNPAAAAFFDGKTDPAAAVLHFDVADGEFWDAPSGRIGSAVAVLKAAVTGNPAGDHGTVS